MLVLIPECIQSGVVSRVTREDQCYARIDRSPEAVVLERERERAVRAELTYCARATPGTRNGSFQVTQSSIQVMQMFNSTCSVHSPILFDAAISLSMYITQLLILHFKYIAQSLRRPPRNIN
jgi:hypothetical protein